MNETYGGHHSGYVALVGRPNAGKSTLLNRILGTKLVAVTPRPQTTRHRIFGIYDREEVQIVFQDTPGLLEPDDALHEFMMQEAQRALSDADVVVWLIDGIKGVTRREQVIAAKILADLSVPLLITFNKMDAVPLDKRENLQKGIGDIPFPETVDFMYISALTGGGVEDLLEKIVSFMPEGPKFYPPDQLSDRAQRFFVEEIIREKAFILLREEIPYSLAVQVESMKEREDGLIAIQAVLYVERESQKRILIGKGGGKIKDIGREARLELETLLNARVFLELWVKVSEQWRRKSNRLKELGFSEER